MTMALTRFPHAPSHDSPYIVCGSRPDGDTVPSSTSASACAPAWPPEPIEMIATAGCAFANPTETAPPPRTMSTVGLPTAITACRTSRLCFECFPYYVCPEPVLVKRWHFEFQNGSEDPHLRNRHLFFEFSLCLSRACLGKMFVFIYKWRK
eukprot:COSAG06_NODE_11069_length_1573_cov_1.207598_1_plen_150_part_10